MKRILSLGTFLLLVVAGFSQQFQASPKISNEAVEKLLIEFRLEKNLNLHDTIVVTRHLNLNQNALGSNSNTSSWYNYSFSRKIYVDESEREVNYPNPLNCNPSQQFVSTDVIKTFLQGINYYEHRDTLDEGSLEWIDNVVKRNPSIIEDSIVNLPPKILANTINENTLSFVLADNFFEGVYELHADTISTKKVTIDFSQISEPVFTTLIQDLFLVEYCYLDTNTGKPAHQLKYLGFNLGVHGSVWTPFVDIQYALPDVFTWRNDELIEIYSMLVEHDFIGTATLRKL